MQRRSLLGGAALLLLPWSAHGGAAGTGKLRLPRLPADAQIYVDGKPAVLDGELLTLSPGWHDLQIEHAGERARAFRKSVRVLEGGVRTVDVIFSYVIPVGPQSVPAGPPGPPGPPGPAGRPALPAGPPLRPEALAGLFVETLESLLAELEARRHHWQNTLAERGGIPSGWYYYVPAKQEHPLPPRGPSGPLGLRGAPGLPGDALLLRTLAGRPLLEEVKEKIGVSELETAAAALEPRVLRLPSRTDQLPIPMLRRITLYSPESRAQLDKAIEQQAEELRRRTGTGVPGPRGAMGPMGPRGRRGPDGPVPADAKPVVIGADQVEQVVKLLQEDRELWQRVQRLRADVADVDLWTADLEFRASVQPAKP